VKTPWALACLLALGALAGCGGSNPESAQSVENVLPRVRVTLARAERGSVAQDLELVGNLVARRRTEIVTDVDGVIQSIASSGRTLELEADGETRSEPIALGLGHAVKKGDVLVRIDPTDYELALAAAQADLNAANKNLVALRAWRRPEDIRRLRAAREEAAARTDLAKLEFDRTKELRAKDVVSASEFDRAASALAVARAEQDRAEAELAVALNGPTPPEVALAEAKIAQAQALVNIRQDDLDRTTIKAPYDGVITERYVDVGERVTAMPRIEILELMDLSVVFVEVGVPERHVHQVGVRDDVRIEAEGVPEPLEGRVVLVNDKVDTTSRTYRVRVGVDNRAGRLKAGQFVRVTFTLAAGAERLVVPRDAVTYGGGQPQVFVYADDAVTLRDVRLGLTDGARVEIVNGLRDGERIVVDDPAVLSDGMAVEVREAAEAADPESSP
jgi:HlyD family secretion protein